MLHIFSKWYGTHSYNDVACTPKMVLHAFLKRFYTHSFNGVAHTNKVASHTLLAHGRQRITPFRQCIRGANRMKLKKSLQLMPFYICKITQIDTPMKRQRFLVLDWHRFILFSCPAALYLPYKTKRQKDKKPKKQKDKNTKRQKEKDKKIKRQNDQKTKR